jgi:hypothetical protein
VQICNAAISPYLANQLLLILKVPRKLGLHGEAIGHESGQATWQPTGLGTLYPPETDGMKIDEFG